MPFTKVSGLSLPLWQREILEKIARRSKSLQQHVTRARILLLAADGFGNQEIAERLGINRKTVYHWRKRWSSAREFFSAIKDEDEKQLHKSMLKFLSDNERSGAPATYNAEVVCQIIAVACENPQECDHPISHWTPQALRLEVIKRGIVKDISVRQIGRFLKRSRSKTAPGALLGNT